MHKYIKHNLEMMNVREWTGKIVRIIITDKVFNLWD